MQLYMRDVSQTNDIGRIGTCQEGRDRVWIINRDRWREREEEMERKRGERRGREKKLKVGKRRDQGGEERELL